MKKKFEESEKLRVNISVATFFANLSPVKLAGEPSNFLTTTDSTVIKSLSLYLVSEGLRKTLNLSHLLQYTSGMSVDDSKFVLDFLW